MVWRTVKGRHISAPQSHCRGGSFLATGRLVLHPSQRSNRDDWGFNNTLAEAGRLVGARYNDPHFIWVLYSDGPGNKGRGGSGVTCLPEDDLLGLIGKHPTQKHPARWVYGLGHELGHAFGLPHPADIVRDKDALMWAGFYMEHPENAY